MQALLARNWRFFLLVALAGLALRLVFIFRFPGVVEDSFVYGDIAKNWLQHGIYGLSGPDEISSTYIRLPGYPAFLALIFALFGLEHYRAVLAVQMFVDLGTCFLIARLGFGLLGPKPAKMAFALASLCPFLANYSAAALTETLEIFFTALALCLAFDAFQTSSLLVCAGAGASAGLAMLLRPDGALLVIALEVYLLERVFLGKRVASRRLLLSGGLLAAVALLPLLPWAWRNWRVFHRFQPLAPRYANEENEFVPMGFNRWVKTWMADYTSVEEIYWPVPGSPIDAGKLPARAFDSPEEQAETRALISDYNRVLHISPALDERFAELAGERIHRHPMRYYLGLPLVRIADMWLRPRTEMLPVDSRWWELNDELRWSVLALSLGAINLFYMACAIVGVLNHRRAAGMGILLWFVLLRSAFLGSMENPEPRYTLEMYPAVIVWAAGAMVSSRKNLA
jgi:4-amino-4-deoxy-L-arabinose transferase-like glycosyltransferase